MTEPNARRYLTPRAILVASAALITGTASLAFNPFFVVSIVAVLLGSLTLTEAARYDHYVLAGMLRIVGVLAVMTGLGGAVALAFPGLGVR